MVAYDQAAIQRRMQSPYQASPQQPATQTWGNQFTMPGQTGGPDKPPDFYDIPADNYQKPNPYKPGGDGQGPMFNPYAEVGKRRNNNPYPEPYPGITVSPTGEVTGAAPVPTLYGVESDPAVTSKQAASGSGNNGGRKPGNEPRQGTDNNTNGGKNNNGGNNGGGAGAGNNGGGNNGGGKGTQNPANDPHMNKQGWDKFMKGFYKDYSEEEKKWLGQDSTLSEMLRNLVASQGDFASQYNTATGNIADTFRRQIGDIQEQRGVAKTELNDNMAASGMTRSSGYGTELGNLMSDFSRQAFDARMAKTTGLADQMAERQNFMRQLEIAKTQARADALRRYAAEQMDVAGLIG